jgi:hypothetical protein
MDEERNPMRRNHARAARTAHDLGDADRLALANMIELYAIECEIAVLAKMNGTEKEQEDAGIRRSAVLRDLIAFGVPL